MGRKMLRLDCSASTALAVCRVCDWRDGPYTDRTGARLAAARHRQANHPKQAADAASARRRRTS